MLTRLGENDSAFVTTVGVHSHGFGFACSK